MKKLFLTTILITGFASGAFACTQQEAIAKMTKITQSAEYKSFVGSAKTAEDAKKVGELTTKLSNAGSLMASQKNDESCVIYQEIQDQLEIK